MSKLDDDIRRAQKNAGNKLYRIRRKGAVNADELDPRLDRAEWRGMDYNAKRRYLRKLQNFTSRENRIYVQSNDVAVPEKLLKKYRALEKKSNSAKQNLRTSIERNRIRSIQKEVRELHHAAKELQARGFSAHSSAVEFIRSRARVFDYNLNDMFEMVKRSASNITSGHIPGSNKFSDLYVFTATEDFVSVSALEAAIQAQGEMLNRITGKRVDRYKNWQAGIASKLRDNGYGDIAEMVFLLDVDQMDYLHYMTDWDAFTNMFKYEEDYQRGITKYSDHQLDQAADHILELIDAAFTVSGKNKKARIGSKDWRNRWENTRHGKQDVHALAQAWRNRIAK